MQKAQGYGNRWQQNVTTGSGPNPSYTFDANNRISGSGVVYDAAGNITNDGLGHTYTYDAEHRLLTVAGPSSASYVYDSIGQRVRQTVGSSSKDYVFDQAGRVITQMSPGWARSELYAGGLHVATYTNSTTYFDHRDWLGTVRARSSVSGASVETCTSLPFGDAQTCTGTDWSPLHFTGQDWDSESNLTHFMFRQLSTTEGRWITPDPLGLGAVDPGNPQTWNRYAYVGNNPLNAVDPLGLWRSDVFGTAKFGNDPFRDPGGAAFAAMLQQFYTQAGFGSPLQEGLTSYLSSIPGYDVQGGELYWHAGFWTPNPEYDPDVPGSLIGTTTSVLVDMGPANNGGILDDVANWFRAAKFLGVGGSFWIPPLKIPVGWSPGANFVSDGTQIHGCASLLAGGVGAKVPGGSVGLLFGDKSKAAAIIQGGSVTLNVNLPIPGGPGVQIIASSAGTLAGPTVGTPGVSLQVGYGGPCAP